MIDIVNHIQMRINNQSFFPGRRSANTSGNFNHSIVLLVLKLKV